MYYRERIVSYIESLALLLQESTEHGELDSSAYSDALELMGWLAGLLREEAAV